MSKSIQYIKQFISINKKSLIGLLVGLSLGFLYWLFIGSGFGTYYLSSECWLICLVGALTGGLLFSLPDISEQ